MHSARFFVTTFWQNALFIHEFSYGEYLMNLLHVVASPRGPRSASNEVAHAFIEAFGVKYPQITIDTMNVWETVLPEFDGPALDAKYAGIAGTTRTTEQKAVWEQIESLASRFHAAKLIVFSVPMWNFGIPYRLKHLIDVVSQKDLLFTFDERGLVGTLGGRKVVVVGARGIMLGGDFPTDVFDFQIAYMAAWSRMVGISDFHSISVEKTLFGPDADNASRASGCGEAIALAATL